MVRTLPALSLLTLVACIPNTGEVGGDDTADGYDCTAEAVASVMASVTSEAGDDLAEATVTWVGETSEGTCEAWNGDFACGFEVEGEITVTAELPDYVTESVDVVVQADRCHVITEHVDIVLAEEECDADEAPGAWVSVVDHLDAAVGNASVTWSLANADMAPQPCDATGSEGLFACGWGVSGMMEFSASAPGHSWETAAVDVALGVCGPETEDVVITLFPEGPVDDEVDLPGEAGQP